MVTEEFKNGFYAAKKKISMMVNLNVIISHHTDQKNGRKATIIGGAAKRDVKSISRSARQPRRAGTGKTYGL